VEILFGISEGFNPN